LDYSQLLPTIGAIILSYLLGAVPFGLVIARLSGIDDIRKLGSGNIGATNVWRIAGAKIALWVFAFDIGKGVAAVLIAQYVFDQFAISMMSFELFMAICGMAAVIGHVFPIYLKFKGGKGVNTALGVVATLLPVQTVISFGAFIITLMLSRYVSLGSIVAAITLCAALLVQKLALHQPVSNTYLGMTLILGVLVTIAHRKNIVRIISGTENRFSLKASDSGVK
jgi:glycerol-3-phosphate acyltransferase PlsY